MQSPSLFSVMQQYFQIASFSRSSSSFAGFVKNAMNDNDKIDSGNHSFDYDHSFYNDYSFDNLINDYAVKSFLLVIIKVFLSLKFYQTKS